MTTSSTVKNNFLPPGLVSNLQDVLSSRKSAASGDGTGELVNTNEDDSSRAESASNREDASGTNGDDAFKPIILVTNSDGVESPGLASLVEALVSQGLCNVNVCVPQSDKSTSGHSVTLRETVEVVSVEINGATAYEVSGTPVDCVSLALSGALFSWSKPLLVISGINRGSSCGHHMLYSGAVAGAREAMINGVPSISISLQWQKDVSQDSDFKDAVNVCLPLINAAIRDITEGLFPKSCSLSIEVPKSPLTSKGFKVTRQSHWKSTLCWQAISGTRHQAASRFGNQPGFGMQFAQLSRDASAAGAARRLTTQKKNIEIVESVGAAGKSDFKRTVKYFRLEMLDKEQEGDDEDLDFRALENGFVAVTPISQWTHVELETKTAASDWISSILQPEQ